MKTSIAIAVCAAMFASTNANPSMRGGSPLSPTSDSTTDNNNNDVNYQPVDATYITNHQSTQHSDFDDSDKANHPHLNLQSSSGCQTWRIVQATDHDQYLWDAYTQLYPNDLHECYVIKTSPHYNIQLQVTYLDLETGYDKLHIHDIDSYSTQTRSTYGKDLIKSYTGTSNHHNPIYSDGHLMYMTFKTDYSVGGHGWTVKFKRIPNNRPPTCTFDFVGRGYCRTSDNTKGTYDLVCSKSRGTGCSLEECKSKCRDAHNCTGIEYRNQSCELHTGDISLVHYSRHAKCYKYEC